MRILLMRFAMPLSRTNSVNCSKYRDGMMWLNTSIVRSVIGLSRESIYHIHWNEALLPGRKRKGSSYFSRAPRLALVTAGIVIGLVIAAPVTVGPVVVVVPVPVRMPASFIWIPPSVIRVRASLADLPEFLTGVLSLLAFVSMILDGFVQIVICPGDRLLAIISTDLLCSRQHQKTRSTMRLPDHILKVEKDDF
jgi:hypothetical protein